MAIEINKSKKVRILRKVSSTAWTSINKISIDKIPNCLAHIPMPTTTSGAYVNIFKNDEERKRYENMLGLKEYELNPRSTYWHNFSIPVSYEGVELDLSDPLCQLQYKALLASPLVEQLGSPKAMAIAYIEDLDKKTEIVNEKATKKAKAFDLIKTSTPEKLRQVLSALFIKHSSMSEDSVIAALYNIIEGEHPKYGIDDFLNEMSSATLSYRALVSRAVEASVLNRRGASFFLNDDLIGTSLESTVTFLMTPENAAYLASIKEKTKAYFTQSIVA
jgi:hypothetical protein